MQIFIRTACVVAILFTLSHNLSAQDTSKVVVQKKWYETLNIRGYTQVRYNRLFETNPDLRCEQCDRSWGDGNSFFMRRARLVFFGNVHERVYIYIQPDFASAASASGLHFVQLRDLYFDVSLDKKKEFRFRIGQSKVPYGFENMQSSQNRLPLDRNDGVNSAVANERDLGVFFYWAPDKIRKRFAWLVSSGLKGTGDYGVFGLGVYNGQTANRPEMNNNRHVVARLSYPFLLPNGQIIEPGIQAYRGQFVLLSRSNEALGANEFLDQRAAATFVLYPQPFGI
ncbi:MAG: porin, partial [Cytophagaceae bacterium]